MSKLPSIYSDSKRLVELNWLAAKLSDVAPSKALKVEGVDRDQHVWQVNLNHIESNTGELLDKDIQPYSMAGSSTHWFDERHVLYSKLRPYLNKVLLPSHRGLGTTELVPMLPDAKRLNRKFLAYYLRSKGFVDWISTQTAGAKMPRVSMKVFWEHKIPLPPLDEQKKIAAILDAADALRQKDAQLIAKYNALSQSLFLDMFGDPVTNPMGWSFIEIKEVMDGKACNGFFAKKEHYTETGVPIVWITDFINKDYVQTSGLRKVSIDSGSVAKYRLCYADVLFCRSSLTVEGIGKCSIVPKSISEDILFECHIIKIRLGAEVIPEYFKYLSDTPYFRGQIMKNAKTSTMTTIAQEGIVNTKIPLPPVTLQDQFTDRIQAIEAQKQQAQAALQKSEDLFNSLLQRAFKGELTQEREVSHA